MAAQTPIRRTEPVNARDHIRGPRSAEVSLVEYGDFECPYCRAAEPIVRGLMEALGDQLSIAFRHFPMSEVHPHAQHTAELAEAATSQGRFWEMHDMLFANQHALDDASLMKYAAELSINPERVRRDLATHQHARRVAKDRELGLASGVRGTPTFYIDGVRYDGTVALRDISGRYTKTTPRSRGCRQGNNQPKDPARHVASRRRLDLMKV